MPPPPTSIFIFLFLWGGGGIPPGQLILSQKNSQSPPLPPKHPFSSSFSVVYLFSFTFQKKYLLIFFLPPGQLTPLKKLQLHKIITHAPPPPPNIHFHLPSYFSISSPSLFKKKLFFFFWGGGTTWPTHPLSKKIHNPPPPPPPTSIFIFFFFLSLFLHFSKKK